jgi:hypothetical protein
LIATSPHEILYDGTALNLYTFAMAVPATSLTLTDRLAVKLYATNSGGKTTTIHTQDGHLCQIITTFSTGITALNGLTAQVQYFQVGTSGTDFNISSTTATHTFNIPDASATARGLITTGTQTIAGTKTFSDATKNNGGVFLQNASSSSLAGYMNIGGLTNGVKFTSGGGISNTFTLPSATGYTFTFPNATGTIALTSDIPSITGLVPYTGATGAVTLGAYELTSSNLIAGGTSGNAGMLHLKSDVAITSKGNGYTSIGAYAGSGIIQFQMYTGASTYKSFTFSIGALTDNTNRQFTFPNASGTLALTTDLSGYLPLTGGTLTGALSGTSATFSTEVTSSGSQGRFGGWATGAGYQGAALEVGVTGGVATLIGYNRTTSVYIPITISSGTQTTIIDGNTILLKNNSVTALTIASTGAATFSSSVTASSTKAVKLLPAQSAAVGLPAGSAISSTGSFSIYSDSGISGETQGLYYWNGSTYYAALQTSNVASGFSNLLLAKDGGNVGIGTSSPYTKLSVITGGTALTYSGDVPTGMYVEGPEYASTSQSGNITIVSNGTLASGNGGSIVFGAVYSGTNFANIAQVKAIRDNATSGNYSGGLSFSTRLTGGDITEKMRITSGGVIDFNGNSTITSANDKFALGINSTSYAWIQSFGGRTLVLQGAGNNVLIGTTTDATGKLQVNGTIYATGFYESSDIRFKNILETNPSVNVLGIDVIKFTRKDNDINQVRYGYSAQQVQSILPDAVTGTDFLNVNYLDVHTLKIAQLEKEIKELKAKLN